MNQCEKVLDYMQRHGSISTMEAYEQLKITRLSGRIFDLKQRGVAIETIRNTEKNSLGEVVPYVRYKIKEKSTI